MRGSGCGGLGRSVADRDDPAGNGQVRRRGTGGGTAGAGGGTAGDVHPRQHDTGGDDGGEDGEREDGEEGRDGGASMMFMAFLLPWGPVA